MIPFYYGIRELKILFINPVLFYLELGENAFSKAGYKDKYFY